MLFSRKPPKLPDYHGTPLNALLADPVWAEPLAKAGIAPKSCELVHQVTTVLVASPRRTFSDGMPFLMAGPAVVFAQEQLLALAVPEDREILVLTQNSRDARLMLTRFGAIQLVFGTDGSVDGWTFEGMKKDTPAGKEFGDALRQFVTSG